MDKRKVTRSSSTGGRNVKNLLGKDVSVSRGQKRTNEQMDKRKAAPRRQWDGAEGHTSWSRACWAKMCRRDVNKKTKSKRSEA